MNTKAKKLDKVKINMSFSRSMLIAIWVAVLMCISTTFFILPAKIYSPGLSGIASGFSYTISDVTNNFGLASNDLSGYGTIYWIVYTIINIPMVIFMLITFSKRFFYLSFTTLVFNICLSQIFSVVIPHFTGRPFLLFDISKIYEGSIETGMQNLIYMIVIIISAFVGGIIYGYSLGKILKIGACSMGIDPLAKWIAIEKNYNINNVLFIFSISNSLFWIFIRAFTNSIPSGPGSSIWPPISDFDTFIHRTIFAPELIGSLVFLVTYSIISGKVYSGNAKMKVTIRTKKIEKLSIHFNKIKYHRGHSIVDYIGGRTNEKKQLMEMIIKYDEVYDVIEEVAIQDSEAFIVVEKIENTYDIHNWKTILKDDFKKFNFKLKK